MSTPGPRVMWLIQHDPPPTPLCFRDRAQWQDYLTQLAASGERITRREDTGKHAGRRVVRVVFARIDYCQDCQIGGSHIHAERWREMYLEAAAEIERLRKAAEHAAHQLEKARIWGGTEWHYNPLHPLHYRSALERLRDVLRA